MHSKNITYIPAVDHLRGFAALLIIFYHGYAVISYKLLHSAAFLPDRWLQADSIFSALLIEGHTAVAMFMVLSGFIFTIGTYSAKVDYKKFIGNRFLRTYPMFLLLLFVAIAATPAAFTFSGFAQSVFFMANAPGSLSSGPYTSMFWAVAVEWQFYLIFPFIIAFTNKTGSKFLLLAILTFVVLRGLMVSLGADAQHLSYWTIIGRLDQFLSGMIAAILYLKFFKKRILFDVICVVSFIGLLTYLYLYNQSGGWPGQHSWKIITPTIEGALWSAIIIGYLSLSRWLPSLIGKIFSLVGVISYSIYLIHFPIVWMCMENNWVFIISESNHMLNALSTTFFIILPITILISTLTYNTIERPFLKLRKVYK